VAQKATSKRKSGTLSEPTEKIIFWKKIVIEKNTMFFRSQNTTNENNILLLHISILLSVVIT